MKLLVSQQFNLDLANCFGGGATPSIAFGPNAVLELVNNSSIQLNGSTPLSSVSPYFGGYTGYGHSSITWNAAGVNSTGPVECLGSSSIFRPTDSASPQNMYGVVLLDKAAAVLLAAGPFDAPPLPMASALNTITVTLSFQPANNAFVATVVS